MAAAVRDQDAVVHLAFVIPKISATGVDCEKRPDWAREINVGGTGNLLAAMSAEPRKPALIFASSLHVFGQTQDRKPPRKVTDRVRPVEHYAHHKVECEGMVRAYSGRWAIFRLAAALPVRLILDPGVFDVPLGNRIEYIHSRDVATAIANALDCPAVWGRTWLIGGGSRCQFYYRDLVTQVLQGTGVGMLPSTAFSTTPFSTDWLDTLESQRLLGYQQHTLEDYVRDVQAAMGWRRFVVPLVRPLLRLSLLKQSPYYRQRKAAAKGLPRVVQAG